MTGDPNPLLLVDTGVVCGGELLLFVDTGVVCGGRGGAEAT
jgi:hypothetical protein